MDLTAKNASNPIHHWSVWHISLHANHQDVGKNTRYIDSRLPPYHQHDQVPEREVLYTYVSSMDTAYGYGNPHPLKQPKISYSNYLHFRYLNPLVILVAESFRRIMKHSFSKRIPTLNKRSLSFPHAFLHPRKTKNTHTNHSMDAMEMLPSSKLTWQWKITMFTYF